jgi:AbrB family looped-hinge helix DNA binding protein
MAAHYSTMSTKGQAVIPSELREALGIAPGTRLAWRQQGDTLIVEPDTLESRLRRIDALQGITAGGPSMCDELIEERRRDQEREQAEGW